MAERETNLSNFSELDDATIFTPATPPESVIIKSFISVPEPGAVYELRAITDGRILTLFKGRVILAPPDSDRYKRGCSNWACFKSGNGWLGFRNDASNMVLGHDGKGNLVCVVNHHRENEWCQVLPRSEAKGGGFVLVLTHHKNLWHISAKKEGTIEKLGHFTEGGEDGLGWEFIEIALDE